MNGFMWFRHGFALLVCLFFISNSGAATKRKRIIKKSNSVGIAAPRLNNTTKRIFVGSRKSGRNNGAAVRRRLRLRDQFKRTHRQERISKLISAIGMADLDVKRKLLREIQVLRNACFKLVGMVEFNDRRSDQRISSKPVVHADHKVKKISPNSMQRQWEDELSKYFYLRIEKYENLYEKSVKGSYIYDTFKNFGVVESINKDLLLYISDLKKSIDKNDYKSCSDELTGLLPKEMQVKKRGV